MAYSNSFWHGVEKVGSGLGGLAGAYSFATSWGSTATLAGLCWGAAGIIVGGFVGALVGALALTFAVWVTSAVVDTVLSLTNEVVEGAGMVFGCN